ncbi:MAG: hypothetical protein FH749_01020 [Firmicutes bacterium]|nr:hypothetical protein [Bacillota bacterium]
MKRLVLPLILVALLAIPVGFALAGETEQSERQELITQAARDMGLDAEQALEIMEQARELQVRIRANGQDITYEEMQEQMEERWETRKEEMRKFREEGDCFLGEEAREQLMQQRRENRGQHMRLRLQDGCDECPFNSDE